MRRHIVDELHLGCDAADASCDLVREVGAVDHHGDIGVVRLGEIRHLSDAGENARDVGNHLAQSHHGCVGDGIQALHPGRAHALAANTDDARLTMREFPQGQDELLSERVTGRLPDDQHDRWGVGLRRGRH